MNCILVNLIQFFFEYAVAENFYGHFALILCKCIKKNSDDVLC